jgi:nicotinate-nucleotide pyrophosphorylase (carboxylating)
VAEDLPDGDLTTDVLFPDERGSFPDGSPRGGLGVRARCVARTEGVACGVAVVEAVYRKLDPAVSVRLLRGDGERLAPGDVVLEVCGPARSVLRGERIALNFLAHLSGIASTAARWAAALDGYPAVLLDTRKTTPGWRSLEKYAVRAGGGTNHRRSLSDGVLVKDNHLKALRGSGAGSLRTWVETLRRAWPGRFLELEVDTREEFLEARGCDVDAILLDNFPLEDLRWAVARNRELPGRRPALEASGGIRLENLRAVAATGVDRISVGALTHSAPALDLSLEAVGVYRLEDAHSTDPKR